jgi:hypothetical protein
LCDEHVGAIERKIFVDAALKECASRSRVDDRGPQPTQIADGALGKIDGFNVRFVEQFLVHMLANDADPHSVQCCFVREAAIGLRGQPADAERRQLIVRVVAGDDLEHAGGILDGAAQRPHARVKPRGKHAIAADQFLRRR